MLHQPVMLDEILSLVPSQKNGKLLDVTAGGGGHFFAILKSQAHWTGECWDQDPLAAERIHTEARALKMSDRIQFHQKNFSEKPHSSRGYDLILADLGVSSFQLDDRSRGMSLCAETAPDFRMNPNQGTLFQKWFAERSESEIKEILEDYGEEPKAKILAREMKKYEPAKFRTARSLADAIAESLRYKSPSRIHPATRAFQAFRIAINDELGALTSLMRWAPDFLNANARLAILSFHSLEDRIVKSQMRDLAKGGSFVILTSKPRVAGDDEVRRNPRARSAKLRALERSDGKKLDQN